MSFIATVLWLIVAAVAWYALQTLMHVRNQINAIRLMAEINEDRVSRIESGIHSLGD